MALPKEVSEALARCRATDPSHTGYWVHTSDVERELSKLDLTVTPQKPQGLTATDATSDAYRRAYDTDRGTGRWQGSADAARAGFKAAAHEMLERLIATTTRLRSDSDVLVLEFDPGTQYINETVLRAWLGLPEEAK